MKMSDDRSDTPDDGNNQEETDLNVGDTALNRAINVLTGQQRRIVIDHLRNTSDGVASIDDLADSLLVHDPNVDDRNAIKMKLHHQTLPKLEEVGIIDFDPRTDTARYHGHAVIECLLDTLASGSK